MVGSICLSPQRRYPGTFPFVLGACGTAIRFNPIASHRASTSNTQKSGSWTWTGMGSLTPLPLPAQVVIRVEVIDEISRGKLATEYRYHHGYWHGGEREFRGFGRVDQFDTETFED